MKQRSTVSLESDIQVPLAGRSPASEDLVQLAYCSLPNAELDSLSFSQMIRRARLANAAHNVTGLLLTNTRLVIQWIEGPLAEVSQLWRNIEQDSRHHSVVRLLYKEHVSNRLFDRFRVRYASRNEMSVIVREALVEAQKDPSYRHDLGAPIATLSILLDPGLSQLYSTAPETAQKAGHD